MNRLTIVCGMKWNWPASFTMWNTIRSAPVWYRIQPIGLGRAQGWQAKAPAPQLPQTLAKCRNSRRRLPAGVSADRMSAVRAESPLHGGDWPSFFDPVVRWRFAWGTDHRRRWSVLLEIRRRRRRSADAVGESRAHRQDGGVVACHRERLGERELAAVGRGRRARIPRRKDRTHRNRKLAGPKIRTGSGRECEVGGGDVR